MGFIQEFFELFVLDFKVSKFGSSWRIHAAKTWSPLEEVYLANITGLANYIDGHTRVSLFEEANDLLIGKSWLFDSLYSPK